MADNPYRSAGQNERGVPVPSPDASQSVSSERGQFDTFEQTVLARLLEYVKAQNPCWVFSWNREAGDELAIGDWLDTQADLAVTGAPPAPHNILSVSHADATPAGVVRGDLVTGQVGPVWARLAKGAAGTVLTSGALDLSWVAPTVYDNISVNGVACTDADLDDATPAAPASSLNVKWQKDALAPNNVSAYIGYGAGLNVAAGVLVCTITQYTDEMAEDAIGGIVTASTSTTWEYDDAGNKLYVRVRDTDADTQIQIEEGADDDTIRFDTAGTERTTIGSTGTLTHNAGAVFNENGDSVDFRVESNLEANMILVDGTNDHMHLGGSANCVTVNKGGHMTFEGTGTVWQDVITDGLSTKLPAIGNPSFAVFLNGTYLYWFSATQQNMVFANIQLPHAYKEGTDIVAHVHWIPKTLGAAGQVVSWGLEYTWANIGQTYGATTTIYSNTHSPADAALVASRHYTTSFAAISGAPGGINKTISSVLVCRLFRDATGGGLTDDYTDTAGLLFLDIHCECDSVGSNTESSKT